MIGGSVAPGFEAVRAEFEANFRRRGELGAACAAYHRGAPVVDLWGGYRDGDRHNAWGRDTLVLMYSTSKGLAAMTLAVAHSRGWLDYDAAVASYWPEFAQNGKGNVTVRQLLSHQAGLCAIDEPLNAARLADLDGLAELLARQRPAWPPGTRQGYHALSLGWYEGELLRRVDPQDRSLGRFFAEEIADRLELEFYIGLPSSVPADRIATINGGGVIDAVLHPRGMPAAMLAAFMRPSSLTARVFGNPRLRTTAGLDSPEYRRVEIPAGGGIGLVRSVARAYSELATGGHGLELSRETLAQLTAPPQPPSAVLRDQVLMTEASFSLGFARPSRGFEFGSSQRAFGHPGAGGSFAFADPDLELSFAYAPNRLGHHLRDDPREKALRDAVYDCVSAVPAASI
ncbi:MAG: beta-lactamase family protein [Solirubrobacterales bacterium]|nr:beta-lactamase family protein [Solirubrobacterales bacterium]